MPNDNNLEEKLKAAGKQLKTLSDRQGKLGNSNLSDESETREPSRQAQRPEPSRPIRQKPGESDSEFRRRQERQEQAQNIPQEKSNYGPFNESIVPREQQKEQTQRENPKNQGKSGFTGKVAEKIGSSVDKMDNWSNKNLNSKKLKGKFNESLVPIKQDYANKAQQAKQEFEERMLRVKEAAQTEPIKQRSGESDLEFRRRQQQEDDNTPENVRNRNLADIVKQRGKKELRRGVRKGTDVILKSSPKLAAATKEAREAAEMITKRREEIQKLVKERTEKISKRVASIKRRFNAAKIVQKKLQDEAEKIALAIIRQAAAMLLRIILAAASGVIGALGEVLVVVLIIIAVIAAITSVCSGGGPIGSACSAISGIF